jgi:predicted thioesterase
MKTSQLMLCREIIAVCYEIRTKHISTLCGLNVELYIKIQSVSRSKHSVSVIKTSQLMLYREIITVCSEIHTKHINTLCGQNVELLNVQLVVYIVIAGLQNVLYPFYVIINLNFFLILSPYRSVNTLRLGYTNQSVNAV